MFSRDVVRRFSALPLGAFGELRSLIAVLPGGLFIGFLFIFEPSHEIMERFILRKLILQTRMRSHAVSDIWSDPSSTSIL